MRMKFRLPRSLSRHHSRSTVALLASAALGLLTLAIPAVDRAIATRAEMAKLDALATLSPEQVGAPLTTSFVGDTASGSPAHPGLASWQTIGGCGAGAAGGSGVGIKWIGRNVSGGLFHLELQGNYVDTPYGHDWVAVTLITRDIDEKWNLGVSVPYLYKFISDPYGLNVDLANKGPGDVNVMVTRRFGDINDTSVMLAVGLPTGAHEATFRVADEYLKQEQQLGLGKPTASLVVDHIIDNLWGPVVLGGTLAYRGGENELKNYRAPTGSLYGYASYLLGPFAPALGVSVTGWKDHDRNRADQQGTPLFNVAANASIEYAADWIAILAGASIPYQYDGLTEDSNGRPRSPWNLGTWIFGLGVALAPF